MKLQSVARIKNRTGNPKHQRYSVTLISSKPWKQPQERNAKFNLNSLPLADARRRKDSEKSTESEKKEKQNSESVTEESK